MQRGFRCITVALSAVLVFTFGAYAEEQYQTEISGIYSRTNGYLTNGGQGIKTTVYGASAEIFFQPVNTEEHPYAEAAFLERVGSVGARAAQLKLEGRVQADGPMFGIGANLAKPGFPLAFELMYTRSKIDEDQPLVGTFKGSTLSTALGNYFTDTLLAGVEYDYSSNELEFTGLEGTIRERNYALFAKYVLELGHGSEVSIEASVGKATETEDEVTDRNTEEEILADYYFNKSLSVGAGFGKSTGDLESTEGKTLSANARYFFSPAFSVQAVYERFRNSNDGEQHENMYQVIVAGRF